MYSSLKICITGKFSDFAQRSLLSAGGPYENQSNQRLKQPYLVVVSQKQELAFIE